MVDPLFSDVLVVLLHYLVCHTRQVVQTSLPCWCVEFVLHMITPPTDVKRFLTLAACRRTLFSKLPQWHGHTPNNLMEVVYLFSELLCFIFLNNQRQGFDSCFEAQRALLLNTSRSLLAVFSFRVLLITRVTRCAQYVSRVSSSSSRSVLCDYR